MARAPALALLFAAAGCARQGSLLVVSVEAPASLPTVDALHVTAFGAARSGLWVIPVAPPGIPPARVFGIEIPPGVTAGFSVHVAAFAGATELASGDTYGTVTDGVRRDLTVVLGSGADMGATDLAGHCSTHSDCASGACRPDGTCAPASDIAYVYNRGVSAAACAALPIAHDGLSPNTAFCTISEGLDTFRSFVVVAGSNSPYDYIVVNKPQNAGMTLVGPGPGATPPATIGGVSATDPLDVMTNNFTVDGMDIAGKVTIGVVGISMIKNSTLHDSSSQGLYVSGGSIVVSGSAILRSSSSGIFVNQSSSLAVTGSRLASNAKGSGDAVDSLPAAITIYSGSATIDRSSIGPDNGVGFYVANGASYAIANSYFYNNRGFALIFDQTTVTTGVFQFNTVVRNGRAANCHNTTFESSIFFDNMQTGAAEFNSNCYLLHSVTSADTFTPDFVNPGSYDYHLRTMDTKNLNCCIDKVSGPFDGGAAMLPTYDFYGNRRPRGRAWDIGAEEVQ